MGLSFADPRGAPGTSPGSNFFHYHGVFGKKLQNTTTLGVGAPTPRKILDAPLGMVQVLIFYIVIVAVNLFR